MIVDKVADPTPKDEARITFNYSRVTEDLPTRHIHGTSKVQITWQIQDMGV